MPENQTLLSAIRFFNDGYYWEVHEVLEPAWSAAQGVERDWLAGLILFAGALHQQRTRRNADAARRLCVRGLRRWCALPDARGGIRLRDLERDVQRALNDPNFIPSISREPVL